MPISLLNIYLIFSCSVIIPSIKRITRQVWWSVLNVLMIARVPCACAFHWLIEIHIEIVFWNEYSFAETLNKRWKKRMKSVHLGDGHWITMICLVPFVLEIQKFPFNSVCIFDEWCLFWQMIWGVGIAEQSEK